MEDQYIYGIKCWDKFPNVTVSIETITPQVAIAMLERNVKNRNIKRLETLIETIGNGAWRLNGSTIVFDSEGNLVDGQHRLTACIKADVPITTIVVRGVDSETQVTMDSGYKRTLQDFLKLAGYKECSLLAAITLALMRKDRYGLRTAVSYRSSAVNPTSAQGMDFVNTNYNSRIKPIMTNIRNFKTHYKGISTNTIAPLFEEFRNISIEDYEYFFGMIVGRYTPTRTVFSLIQRLSAQSDRKTKLPDEYIAAYFIKTWNAFVDGVEPGSLMYRPGGANPEHFPTISHGIDREQPAEGRDAA